MPAYATETQTKQLHQAEKEPPMSTVTDTLVQYLERCPNWKQSQGAEWQQAKESAQATDDSKDRNRSILLMSHLRGVILPRFQDYADQNGFGEDWQALTREPSNQEINKRVAARLNARVEETDLKDRASREYQRSIDCQGVTNSLRRLYDPEGFPEPRIVAEVVGACLNAAYDFEETWLADELEADMDYYPIGLLQKLTAAQLCERCHSPYPILCHWLNGETLARCLTCAYQQLRTVRINAREQLTPAMKEQLKLLDNALRGSSGTRNEYPV